MPPPKEQFLVSSLDASSLGLVATDAQGVIRYINGQAAAWDQAPPRALLDQAMPEGFPGWLSTHVATQLRAAVREGVARRFTERSPALGLWLETRVWPGAAGTIVWVGPAEVGDARPAASDANVLHELMQPLGAIGNYAELIRRQAGEPSVRHATEIVRIVGSLATRLRSLWPSISAPTALRSGSAAIGDDEQRAGDQGDTARDR